MLYRKKEKDILKWIKKSEKALLVTGARQVGKTYLIRKCLEKAKCDYVEFNLIENPKLVNILESANNMDELIMGLSLFANKKIEKYKTYIFFDEIQKYKEIVTKIKFFVDDGSFRFILSGSLLGVEIVNLKSAPVGYLQTITMYPLDFEEFLQVFNVQDSLIQNLYSCFCEKKPVNETINAKMLDIFNNYLIVGGMPSAVAKYKESSNIDDIIIEHNSIVEQYKNDFTRYEEENKKLLLNNIYDLIPSEIGEKNKRFNFSDIKKKLKFERYENNFLWLKNAGVALPVYNVTEPKTPLLISEKRNLFKLFLSDVGLLTTIYGKNSKIKILTKDTNINNGSVFENVVAQELYAHNIKPYYFNSKKQGELDFVIEYKGKVLPIEVKSGKDYDKHSALKNVLQNNNYGIDEAFVFANTNVKNAGNITYYPIYMCMFLKDECDKEIKLEKIDMSMYS